MPRFAQTADLLSVVQTCRRQGGHHGVFRQALMAKSGREVHLYCLNRPPESLRLAAIHMMSGFPSAEESGLG